MSASPRFLAGDSAERSRSRRSGAATSACAIATGWALSPMSARRNPRAAQLIRLGVGLCVERLPNRAPQHLAQVIADLSFVDPDNLTHRLPFCTVIHCRVPLRKFDPNRRPRQIHYRLRTLSPFRPMRSRPRRYRPDRRQIPGGRRGGNSIRR